MNEYEKQAQEFLQSTGTKFTVEFVEHGKYFEDDTEPRDIYKVTLRRGDREFTFRFGQSLQCSGRYIVMYCCGEGLCTGQRLTEEQFKQYRGKLLGSPRWCKKNKDFEEPTAYDVLAAVTKFDPGTFEDFCGAFGLDTDSRKAEKMYEAVKNEYMSLCMLYNSEEMAKLSEIA